MTYCVGVLVREGLVMIADTRTNAGIDNIATFRKLHVFEKPGQCVMAIATAGNLAVSQSVLTLIGEGMEDRETQIVQTITDMPSMFKAAQFVGRAIREVHRVDGISGATRTGLGVTRMLRFWLGPWGYGPTLSRLADETAHREGGETR